MRSCCVGGRELYWLRGPGDIRPSLRCRTLNENMLRMDRAAETKKATRALAITVGLNAALTIAQIVVGVASHSLAVAADAAHQFVDVIALTIAYFSLKASALPASPKRTYGFRRSDSIGALTSSLLLLLSVGWIGIEAIRRLFAPEIVRPWPMIVIGAVGMVVNGTSAFVVHRSESSADNHGHDSHAGHDSHDSHAGHDSHSLSTRAARLHLLTDALGSLVVLCTGVMLTFRDVRVIDPIASLLLCALVIPATLRLIRTSSDVLLDSVPDHLDLGAINEAISATTGVRDVHHVHLWSLGLGTHALSAHIEVDGEETVHATQTIVDQLNAKLSAGFGIEHTTLQLECHPCENPVHA